VFHFLLMRLYFAYFDQKPTLICAETHVKLVGLTVLFLRFYLYISFCFCTYVSFISYSFFLQVYITLFCNYMPLCLGIHEYYSQYSIYVSERLHNPSVITSIFFPGATTPIGGCTSILQPSSGI